jgi:hypothetical protein
VVVVKRREGRIQVTDEGAAAAEAGLPPGWKDVARRIELEYCVNVSRQGVVFLPVVSRGPELTEVEERIATASRALRDELLDLATDRR